MRELLTIDGNQGEGGGQILRTTLAPSPHTMTNAAVLKQVADVDVRFTHAPDGTCTVAVTGPREMGRTGTAS